MLAEYNSVVTDSSDISVILSKLHSSNSSLDIKTINKLGQYESLGISELLNVNHDKNTLFFDAIKSTKLKPNQNIKIFTKHNGIEIYFDTTVTEFNNLGQLKLLNTSIPQTINRKQRRQQFRVEIQNLWKIPVTIFEPETRLPILSYLYNISTGGLNVRSSTSGLRKISKDSIIDTVIQLPNDSTVKCKLLVRKAQTNKSAGFEQLAGKFLNLSDKQEKIIQSFVNTVERRKIQNDTELQVS